MTSLNIQQSTQSSETVTSALIEKLYNLAMNSTVEDENNSLEMSLTGSIYSISAYESSVLYLREKFPNLTITVRDNNFYIKFADSEVERVLVNNDISTDHIGVSKSDVNRLIILPNNLFKNNTTIQSFNELQQFLSVQIGKSCFEGCTNLNQINLSKVTTIEDNAFNGCNALSGSVNCPNLTSIGTNAFKNCSNLQNITSLGLINTIRDSAFSGCTLLETAVLPSNTSIIEQNAFSNCLNLTTVSGLTYVTKLGRAAFKGCSKLTSVDLSNITDLGFQAFDGCTLLSSLNRTTFSGITNLHASVFKNCSNLTGELSFPDLTELIYENGARGSQFQGCANLTKISLGHLVNLNHGYTSSSDAPFKNCTNLKIVDLGDSLTTLSGFNFQGCSNLKAIKLNITTPPSRHESFVNTTSLNVFFGNSNVNIYVPDSAVSTYQATAPFSSFADHIKPLSTYNETSILAS